MKGLSKFVSAIELALAAWSALAVSGAIRVWPTQARVYRIAQ